MKINHLSNILKVSFASLLLCPLSAGAATIMTFTALDALTPSLSVTSGTFTTPASPNDTSDFTFQFIFTTPTVLNTDTALVDLGGTAGTSLKLVNNRLIFRSATGSGGALMFVTSNDLTAATQYNVVGSLFNSPTNTGDFMRLYLNGADGVNILAANHDPDDTVNDFWGTNTSGYGTVGGGDHQVGTITGSGSGSFVAFTTTNGSLNSNLDLFYGTYLDVVPEPSTWAMLTVGLAALIALRRKRQG